MGKMKKTDEEWKNLLSHQEYCVTRLKATEPAFTGDYNNHHEAGTYHCKCCGQILFSSEHKYDSGSGWPSFFKPIEPKALAENTDISHGMVRVEILCANCDAHLGHVFTDGPNPTGLRYCLNSLALKFEPKKP